MRAGIEVTVTPEDRRRLEAIACDRNTAQKHVTRAKVILATADGCGTMEITRRSGLSKPGVWRWQERFMHEGVDGLLRDKTRPPGKPRLIDETIRRVLDLTLSEPPGEATHWTGRMMAKVSGVSLRSVQRNLSGPPIPNVFSPPSIAGSKRWGQPVRSTIRGHGASRFPARSSGRRSEEPED
jgi:transposase